MPAHTDLDTGNGALRSSRALGVSARVLALCVPPLATLVVWSPLLGSYFQGDDFVHLYDIVTGRFTDLLGQMWGGHLLVLYNAAFWAMFQTFGTDPRGYFQTVLATHLLNTVLLYQVVRSFTGKTLLACFGAALWGTCPTLEGTLGWFSVYGQVLLTTFVLAILWSLGHRLARGEALPAGLVLLWSALLAVGSTAFGTGLGVAAVFPLTVALAASPGQLPGRSALVLLLGAITTLVGYRIAFTWSDVSPSERALLSTFSHPGWLPATVALEGHLIGFGATALLFGLLGADQRFPEWTQAAGGTGLAVLVLAALVFSGTPVRRRLVALALMAAGAYAVIAAGRANFYAGLHVPPAVVAQTSRYHYLPLALLTLVVCTAVAGLVSRRLAVGRALSAAAGLWLIVRVAIAFLRPFPVHLADAERAETVAMLASIQEQVAATPAGEVAMIENRPFGLSHVLPDVMPGWAAMFVVFFPESTVDGRPVRFLVSEDDWRRAQARGGRIADLVMRPGARGPSPGDATFPLTTRVDPN